MTTIAQLLQEGSQRLSKISPTPRLDTELLLAWALKRSRAYLLTWPEISPPPAQTAQFWQFIERRRYGEPVAYLIGRREFWSHEFEVGPEVLIPRPETELLVAQALELIPPQSAWRIADLGTGSGAIAIALALERPKAHLFATDLSQPALKVAKANTCRLKAHNVTLVASNWLSAFAAASFDLIVSNPPYVAADDPYLQGDIRFEPALALVGGDDGLSAFRRLIPQAYRCLKPGGWLLLEHGSTQQEAVRTLLQGGGFKAIVCYRDLEDRPRLTQAQRN